MNSQVTVYVKSPVRKIAIAVTAVLILGALFISQARGLYLERDRIHEKYSDAGSPGTIAYCLTQRTVAATNLITVALRTMSEDDREIKDLRGAVTSVNGASSPAEKFAANRELTNAFNALYKILSDTYDGEQDVNTFAAISGQKINFDSAGQQIGNIANDSTPKNDRDKGYNPQVKAFNKKITGLPYSLYAAVAGVNKLELYGDAIS